MDNKNASVLLQFCTEQISNSKKHENEQINFNGHNSFYNAIDKFNDLFCKGQNKDKHLQRHFYQH